MNRHTFILYAFRLVTALALLIGINIVPVTLADDLIIFVDVDATGNNDGLSWVHAYTSLQDALSVATSADEIWVAEGTYKPTDGTDPEISFQLKNGVAVYGGFTASEGSRGERNSDPATNNTILSGDIGNMGDPGDNSNTVVTSIGVTATAVLDGFTIKAGNANDHRGLPHPERSGGGMHNNDSNPTLSNLIFVDNLAFWGGRDVQ